MQPKTIRPGTAFHDRTANYLRNKRQGQRFKNRSLKNKQSQSQSGTMDSKRLDKFLQNHHQSNRLNAPPSFLIPKYYRQEKFGVCSQAMPSDLTTVNHFGREGREDLRDLREVSGRAARKTEGASSQAPELNVDNYITKKAAPETRLYFETIVGNRMVSESRQESKISYKKEKALREKFRSGVTGYLFKEGKEHSRYQRHLKKGEFSDANWRSLVFESSNLPQQKMPEKNYRFENILSLQQQPHINPQRTRNLTRNSCRRNYNFITMQEL